MDDRAQVAIVRADHRKEDRAAAAGLTARANEACSKRGLQQHEGKAVCGRSAR